MSIFNPKEDVAAIQPVLDELLERGAERLAPIAAVLFDGYTVTTTITVTMHVEKKKE